MAQSTLLLESMPHRFVATHVLFGIIGAIRPPMKTGWILLAAFALLTASPALHGQADDPSETFLKAYMTAQQGEKLEHENQFQAALAKYRFAGTLLEQLRKAHPDWQPAIVEYRGRKVSESILRVQDKAGTQENVAGSAETAEETTAVAPPAPAPPVQVSKEKTAAPLATIPVAKEKAAAPAAVQTAKEKAPATPPVQIAKEKAPAPPAAGPKPAPASTPNEVAIEQTTRKLRDRVEQLEAELLKSHTQMTTAENEKQSLNSRLDESKSKLDKAQGDLEKAKTAEKQVRDQLNQAQASLKKTAAAGSNDNKAQEALKSEITELKKALVS